MILAGLSSLTFLPVLGALCLGGFVSATVMASRSALVVTRPLPAISMTIGVLVAMLLVAHWLSRPAREILAEHIARPEEPTSRNR